MHISDVERMRLEKEHKMREGYAVHNNKRFPHDLEVKEHAYKFKDMENKHARESTEDDYKMEHSA
jgi:hypothetical protein